ncbi:MAG: histidine kinase, partial [Lachnospiraceae bacterium]|nr:histidine kinase [Lachnospiraceae bacterium]
QMDPHFLFNTLNTIAGMAELEEAETTEKMIRSLSSIFRYNLQTTAQFAALSREMKVVRDYMYLQQMRFGDRIRYEEEIARDVDPDRVSVPALIIQPLVENAVIHGLSHTVEGGKVCISIRRTEETNGRFIVIRIEDTGEGMDEETLLKVRAEIEAGGRPVRMGTTAQGKLPERTGAGTPEEHSSDEIPGENGSEPKEKSVEAEHAAGAESENELRKERRVGIGLGNVAWRIRDVYKDGNMTIESRKGEGTVVTLFIPEVNDG